MSLAEKPFAPSNLSSTVAHHPLWCVVDRTDQTLHSPARDARVFFPAPQPGSAVHLIVVHKVPHLELGAAALRLEKEIQGAFVSAVIVRR